MTSTAIVAPHNFILMQNLFPNYEAPLRATNGVTPVTGMARPNLKTTRIHSINPSHSTARKITYYKQVPAPSTYSPHYLCVNKLRPITSRSVAQEDFSLKNGWAKTMDSVCVSSGVLAGVGVRRYVFSSYRGRKSSFYLVQ